MCQTCHVSVEDIQERDRETGDSRHVRSFNVLDYVVPQDDDDSFEGAAMRRKYRKTTRSHDDE